MSRDRFISVPTAASILGIGPHAMNAILRRGDVAYIQPNGPTGHRRVSTNSLQAYLRTLLVGATESPRLEEDPFKD